MSKCAATTCRTDCGGCISAACFTALLRPMPCPQSFKIVFLFLSYLDIALSSCRLRVSTQGWSQYMMFYCKNEYSGSGNIVGDTCLPGHYAWQVTARHSSISAHPSQWSCHLSMIPCMVEAQGSQAGYQACRSSLCEAGSSMWRGRMMRIMRNNSTIDAPHTLKYAFK